MTIFIPQVEDIGAFPDEALEDLFAWAEQHSISLYCDQPVRFDADTCRPIAVFEGFADFLPYKTFGEFRTALSKDTMTFVRDPDCLDHRYW